MRAPLWTPSDEQIKQANLTKFIDYLNAEHRLSIKNYNELYDWSIAEPKLFWREIWHFTKIIGALKDPILETHDHMIESEWFPNSSLNFAENLLRRRDDHPAIIFWGEDKVKSSVSYRKIYESVSQVEQYLKSVNVEPTDRIAGYLPNMPQTVIAMLGTTALGAIWSSASPDFGVEGVIDRFGQIAPKVLFTVDGYYYGGKEIDCLAKIKEISAKLPSVEHIVIIPYLSDSPDISDIPKAVVWFDTIDIFTPKDITFERFPFNHPLYIVYSSGTTGKPKCIIHGAGGTLIQHLKEHSLHCDINPGDRVFYFTTCGWMMWNWLVTALASRATLLLYDGSPFYPNESILFDFAEQEKMTLFGTAAKYIDACKKFNLAPKDTHDLSTLRMMTSTGSPLVAESFDYVYRNVKEDICLASIAGGTDIVSCFALGSPVLPVQRGQLQTRGLGMAVEVFNEQGESIVDGKGELVCTAPFPSMPLGFWWDSNDEKYMQAYFNKFPNIWAHGDYVKLTDNGGMVFYGRSDATLNPAGVRIGTSEIYRQVEIFDEILESIAVGQQWMDDTRVILFIKMQEGRALSKELMENIKERIKTHASPRHVPAKIIQIKDIPRTKSGKIVELAVRDTIHGQKLQNVEALANPEALEHFKNLKELQS
jgi:acetoacetyl-CoA synthetase